MSELVHRGEDEKATYILCDVIEKLHAQKAFEGIYSTIEDLMVGFDQYLASQDTQIPKELVKEAHKIYKDSCVFQKERVLLHGDLHHDNVLYDTQRGWLVIDPKGYVGEPCYEVGALLRSPLNYPQSPELIKRRVEIICSRLCFNRDRVIAWAFSQAVLAAIWSVEDGQSPEWFISVAMAFKRNFKAELDFS